MIEKNAMNCERKYIIIGYSVVFGEDDYINGPPTDGGRFECIPN